MLSASRRFVVTGHSRDLCSAWAIYLDGIDERITQLLGRRPPIAEQSPLRVHLQSSEKSKSPPVFGAQAYTGSVLQQKLFVNLAKITPLETLEGVCRLLCNRYVINRQSPESLQRGLQRMPDWFSIGVALNLSARESGEYGRRAYSIWRQGDLPTVEDCLAMNSLPVRVGPRDETLCYAFIRWASAEVGLPKVLDRYLQCHDKGVNFGMADLMNLLKGVESRRELEKSWELSVASMEAKTSIRHIPDIVDIMQSLDHLLRTMPAQYSIFTDDAVNIGNLTDYRDKPWIKGLSERLRARLKSLQTAPDPQWRELFDQYCHCLQALPQGGGNWWQRLRGKRFSKARLKKMFAEAENKRDALSRRVEQYQAYLDQVEAKVYNQPETWDYTPSEAESEYVERVEREIAE